jgi:hypothetical protein
VTFSTRWCAIWLMCSRPSLPAAVHQGAEIEDLGDRAFVDPCPPSTSAVISSMRFLAMSALSASVEAW